MWELIPGIVKGLLGLGDKLIEDKDKKAEYAFKVQEMTNDLAIKILDTKTYPWVDGLVKLAYASQSIITGLFRPVVSAGALLYIFYAKAHGIQLDPMLETVMASAFPGWMLSRHIEKNKKAID